MGAINSFGRSPATVSSVRTGAIEKTRYYVPVGKHLFEVDEFHGNNQGLTLAEVELASPNEPFERPSWLGLEVTNDSRYYNSMLARHPFALWDN